MAPRRDGDGAVQRPRMKLPSPPARPMRCNILPRPTRLSHDHDAALLAASHDAGAVSAAGFPRPWRFLPPCRLATGRDDGVHGAAFLAGAERYAARILVSDTVFPTTLFAARVLNFATPHKDAVCGEPSVALVVIFGVWRRRWSACETFRSE